MRIDLQHIVPLPMRNQALEKSELWNKTVALEPGEQILMRAPSGTGKSSFHSFVSGIRSDYSGTIRFDNTEAKRMGLGSWAGLRAKKMAFIFQELKLIPELTVKDNLLLKNQLTNRFTQEEIISFLAELGIEEKWNDPCNTLSLGQQQRVAVIRGVLQPFTWLVADEPFSHLDTENTQKALTFMQRRVKEENAGFILLSLGDEYGMKFNRIIHL
jgi:ABC-type lipoprotein export system ATPase subunit